MKLGQEELDALKCQSVNARTHGLLHAGVNPNTLDALIHEVEEARKQKEAHDKALVAAKYWQEHGGAKISKAWQESFEGTVLEAARHLALGLPMQELVRHFGPDEQHLLAALVEYATEGLEAPPAAREMFVKHAAALS